MHHHLRSAPSPPASPGTSIRRFYASGLIEAAEAGRVLAALLTAALLGAIVLYSQRPGLAPAAPPLDFEPL